MQYFDHKQPEGKFQKLGFAARMTPCTQPGLFMGSSIAKNP